MQALAALGRKAEAIRYAEACRGPWTSDYQVDSLCEGILLSSGLVEEAYARHGLRANRRSTYLATFRAVLAKYPHKEPARVLADLVETTPGEEGKWFAAAKDAGLYEDALALARKTPCDPATLTRAARDHALKEPAFAVEAGLLALHWLLRGHGYDLTSADVVAAYRNTVHAAERNDTVAATRQRIVRLLAGEVSDELVARVLWRELGS